MKQSLLLVSLSVLISLGGCGGGGGYSSSVTPPPDTTPPPVDPVTPAPAITGISPNSGSTEGGTPVTITGTDFTGATAVKFGANEAEFTVDSATRITAESPAGNAGVVDITVTTEGGTSATGAAGKFTYVAPPPQAAGLWQGHTDGDQAIGGLVSAQSNGGAYWLVYSSASTPAPDFITATNAAGFITGTGTETPGNDGNGAFTSANLREFNFAGAGLAAGSLSAGYTDKLKFGLGLTGTGAGTYTSNASPPTLSNGVSDAQLPVPGYDFSSLAVSATSTVSGTTSGSGTASGTSPFPGSATLVFSATGRTTTGFSDTTNTQKYTFQGGFVGGVFTPTSAEAEVTACTNHPETGPLADGCLFAGVGSITVFDTVSGSVGPTGGTLSVTDAGLANVATTITLSGVSVANSPVSPTFTDGNAPWTINTGGTLALSGTLAFDSYTATLTQTSGTTTLGLDERRLVVDDDTGTLSYDAGTDTLRLVGTTITDISGEMSCSGDAAFCGAGAQPTTLPSTTSQLTGDVIIAIGVPSAGEYQAQVFIGGQSNPISTLTFEGTLPLAPSVTVNFTSDYLASYETAPTLAAVQGNRSGSAGVHSAIQPGASFSIDAAGALTGGMEASGCTYTGTVAPAAKGNVYEVALTFTSGNSCTYSGPFTGVAFFDENGKLTITATNADQDEGFLFIEQ